MSPFKDKTIFKKMLLKTLISSEKEAKLLIKIDFKRNVLEK